MKYRMLLLLLLLLLSEIWFLSDIITIVVAKLKCICTKLKEIYCAEYIY